MQRTMPVTVLTMLLPLGALKGQALVAEGGACAPLWLQQRRIARARVLRRNPGDAVRSWLQRMMASCSALAAVHLAMTLMEKTATSGVVAAAAAVGAAAVAAAAAGAAAVAAAAAEAEAAVAGVGVVVGAMTRVSAFCRVGAFH